MFHVGSSPAWAPVGTSRKLEPLKKSKIVGKSFQNGSVVFLYWSICHKPAKFGSNQTEFTEKSLTKVDLKEKTNFFCNWADLEDLRFEEEIIQSNWAASIGSARQDPLTCTKRSEKHFSKFLVFLWELLRQRRNGEPVSLTIIMNVGLKFCTILFFLFFHFLTVCYLTNTKVFSVVGNLGNLPFERYYF